MRHLVVLALALTACSGSTPDPTSASDTRSLGTTDSTTGITSTIPAPVPTDAVVPRGFERVQARVTEADGTVCELCLWLADDGDRRARGLMFVTDLAGADGMAFVYRAPHTGNFWMKNTVLPLSIAFFDADGAYLDAFDMEPCTTTTCPRYATPPDILVAVETIQGGLADIGMTPGSTLELLDLPCA